MNRNALETAEHNQGNRASLRRRAYALLEDHITSSNRAGAYTVEIALAVVILINSASLILWTVPGLRAAYGSLFHISEYVIIAVFAAEYGLRLWTAPEADTQSPAWRQRWQFARSPAGLIDFSVLVASCIGAFGLLIYGDDLNLTFLLAARLLTRSTKLIRYFPAGRRVGRAIRDKRGQLLTAVVAMLVVLVVASSLMYIAEHSSQPEDFSSIPAAMWWGMVTLTTVGYGDTVPVTPAGRILAAVIAVLGIGLFALPAGIISAGLTEDASADKAPENYCQHCRNCARKRRRSRRIKRYRSRRPLGEAHPA